MAVKGLKPAKGRKLPPITEEDRKMKIMAEGMGICKSVDLGEDIEIKQMLAKKLLWEKAEKPQIRVIIRSGKMILYADYYFDRIADIEQWKDYNSNGI